MNRFFRVACLLACLAGAVPAAAQVPSQLGYTGYLADDAGPLNQTVEITVSVFDSAFAADGQTALWTETHPAVQVTEGAFSLALGSRTAMPVTLFDTANLYMEFRVDGERMDPRSPIQSVPYALRAATAVTARALEGFDPSSVQSAIDVVCPEGSFVAEISASGVATCVESLGAVTAVTALTGLTRTAFEGAVELGIDFSVVQRRVVGSCPTGQFATTVGADGAIACAPATNIDLATIQARISALCPDGQAMFGVAGDGTPQCRAFQRPVGTTSCTYGIASIDASGSITCAGPSGTSIVAGFGLTLTGDTLAVSPTVIQRRVTTTCTYGIQTVNEDGTATCAPNSAVTYSFTGGLRNVGGVVSPDTAIIQARVLGSCEYGIASIAANGTASCATNNDTDSDTTYTAGAGLTLTGTQFSANLTYVQRRVGGDCPNGIRSIGQDGVVQCVAASASRPLAAISCPSSEYFLYGIDSAGQPLCRSIRDFIP